MYRQLFHIIGISDEQTCKFSPEVLKLIAAGKFFSGGVRHYEIISNLLPAGAKWIDITTPLDKVFSQYEGIPEIVVFASGDPLFFGFANTIRTRLPQAKIVLYPTFNSLQVLAHRMLLPYHDMKVISLTGRPWDLFDQALIEGENLIGVLTDRNKTPSRIAERMLEYGYDNYRMTIGEVLGNREKERVRTFSLSEVIKMEFVFPNCLILEKEEARLRPFGIPESDFHLLGERVNMITKAPVRLLTLSMLDLHNKCSFWDVGFCTGSVSIEAKLQFPHLQVSAFEKREEGREMMNNNTRRFGTPGITISIGDFLQTDLSSFPAPDAVFIGGHGGELKKILHKINRVLLPGGVIVFNAVSENSKELFIEGIGEINRAVTRLMRVAIDSFNPIDIMKAE
jgi:precorrin-6Y C5,15-methyltransferase (decarboxylating)